MDWDVFISHAWEDKEDIARPLAEALRRKGLRVWYDEFTLTLGDSLRRSIDRGLAQSRYGVVILSPNFFAKEWPQKELDGLAAREAPGEKVILPVWHNITADQVREYSPTLADRVAVSSDRGLEHVVGELLRVIKPASELTRTHSTIPEATSPTVLERRQPFEPEMILIPAGEFLMGSDLLIDEDANDDEQPQHSLYLPDYYLSKTPVTNVQYAAFVQATGYNRPKHWDSGKPPKGKEDHPVVYVSWYDAVAYCRWLSEATGKSYHLPSEAEWEKGARGSDGRIYPWGNQWDAKRCNSEKDPREGDTTPVKAYPQGVSPYGLLDMAGNVWEWTRSLWGKDAPEPYFEYPYNPENGRENLKASNNVRRVLRSGAFVDRDSGVRCARRHSDEPDLRSGKLGFRVVVSQVERTSAKLRQPVNWEKVGAIAQVIALLIAVIGVPIALGTWLWPNATDFFARPSETPTVTPTSSPTLTPTSTLTPMPPTSTSTNTPTKTPASVVVTATPEEPIATPAPVAGATMMWEKDESEMVHVPAGEFLMGFSESDVEAIRAISPEAEFSVEGEKPQHKVFLDAFYIDKYEVTNARYQKCVKAGACNEPSDTTYYGKADYVQHPVVYVSWYGANAYCRWAGKRLPTEAEWEKAARGDEERTWPWGNTFDENRVNFCDKNCPEWWKHVSVDDGYALTAPVGSYPEGSSLYGALDMAGNVWEWVADWYDPNYYSQSPYRNPPGPDSGSEKIVRGGSWLNGFTDIRAGYRYELAPTHQGKDLGFRCVR
jgi:formylglycine-generating enzyme required for sulfatase activity